MSDPKKILEEVIPSSFFSRVLENENLKRGVAAAVTGALLSVVIEIAWPTERWRRRSAMHSSVCWSGAGRAFGPPLARCSTAFPMPCVPTRRSGSARSMGVREKEMVGSIGDEAGGGGWLT
jgi:hypothetical protein